ncbi:MAG: peptidylprolyl isomerase [Bacteroidetes bacterium]|nr:MAG: peptidylprolyl isomerase [Bacteroidota bacterium]
MKLKPYILLLSLIFALNLFAQDTTNQGQGVVIDQIVAVIGANVILHSDVEAQYVQYRMQEGAKGSASKVKCSILENMLYQKLLLNQAELDSVEVSEVQVEGEMDRRLRHYISMFGSPEKFEEFYKKSILQFKEDLREQVKELMMVENVQQTITADVKVTPSEVRAFFKDIPNDSLPFLNSEFQLAQIVIMPPINKDEKERVNTKLTELRNRILKGESFATLAILYSEDPGSAKNGGELGLHGRGEMFPEFEAVAFSLKDGEVSEITETEAGYHIIQLIERRGDYINVRHILIMPKVSPLDLAKAKMKLDSVALLIQDKKYTFEDAVKKFSEDPSKNNGGLLINPMTGNSIFESDQLDPKVFFVIDKLKVDDISNPVPFKMADGKDAYRILFLKSRTEPHKANLKDDYDKMQAWALEDKKGKVMNEWINEKVSSTFIRINGRLKDCEFENNWVK